MRRILRIAGYTALIALGVAIAVTVDIWPLVWVVGFPLAYAGALGIYKEWTSGKDLPKQRAGDFEFHS